VGVVAQTSNVVIARIIEDWISVKVCQSGVTMF